MEGRILVEGHAKGPALVLDEPLSFWGGLDPATGRIVDVHHPQRDTVVTGRVLVMPGGRGSSSRSSQMAIVTGAMRRIVVTLSRNAEAIAVKTIASPSLCT